MLKNFVYFTSFLIIFDLCIVRGCLITNCPRGGKRGGNFPLSDSNAIRACKSCGPAYAGQCFGPNICCGPFGCLMGTLETIRCKQEGRETCLASGTPCRKNTGKCAADGLCCTQEACFEDKDCDINEKLKSSNSDVIPGLNLYNLLNKYHSDLAMDK